MRVSTRELTLGVRRDLFIYSPDLFVDDEDAMDTGELPPEPENVRACTSPGDA